MAQPTTAAPVQAAKSARSEAQRELRSVLNARAVIFIGVFLALILFFNLQSDGLFFTPRNLSLMLRQGAILGVVAAGVGVLMMMSEIDLSIGSAVFLCGVVAASLSTAGAVPLIVVLLATVATGMVLGALQGVAVVVIGIPSFIATLAGLLAFRGLGLLITNAATVGPVTPDFSAVSESFIPPTPSLILLVIVAVTAAAGVVAGNRRRAMRLSHDAGVPGRWTSAAPLTRTIAQVLLVVLPMAFLAWIVTGFLGIPTALIWVAVIGLALTVLMTRTTYGRNGYLIGANREAAVYSGIRVRRNVFIAFVLMGALYGVAAVLLTARLGSSTPGAGENLELQAIAAAVIGGISLRGGTGTIAGALMGALLLTLINNGMSLLNISSFSQSVIMGIILILALGLDSYFLRRSAR